jgi:hypothetical protein
MSSKIAVFLFFPFLVFMLIGCTQVESPKKSAVQYGGSCSAEYSRDYEKILNWPMDSDIREACDRFYDLYSDVKCFSNVDGSELRIHTTDFDEKCQKNIPERAKNAKRQRPGDSAEPLRTQSLCSTELTNFIIEKQKEFRGTLESYESNSYSDADMFSTSLSYKKTCNQYFHTYKYTECPRDGKTYSFDDLKPYCDEFQILLHKLKVKNPKKFSPQELKPLTGLNLKFHFEDAMVPFYSAKTKVKDTYIVDGKLVAFSQITTKQNYCYFESEAVRFSGELKNEIYKVDIAFITKTKVVFSHTSFNEQWRMICQSRNYFYHQELIEALGDTVTVYE